jgi:ectoine hydroxylase-related dioxygenase (phytanoyl-CoA dioxygenase family)
MLHINQRQFYEENGYLSGIRVVDPKEADEVRTIFDQFESRKSLEKHPNATDPHLSERFVWDLSTRANVLDAIESLLGANFLLMATHFFCKYGPTEAFVAWHQDVTYWGLRPPFAVSAWYAVDDSDATNGCMQVIPGSHREGIREHGRSGQAGNLLSINQEIKILDDEVKRAVNIELRAGEISLHSGLTIHGSRPNRSGRRRCGLAMVYIPTYVQQVADNSLGGRWRAMLVRGENREHYFEGGPYPFPLERL